LWTILNAKLNAVISSQNYKFDIAVCRILLKFCVQNFSNVHYLFSNSQFGDNTQNCSLLHHSVFVIITGTVIKMERLNEFQLRAQAVRLFEENFSYSMVGKKLGFGQNMGQGASR